MLGWGRDLVLFGLVALAAGALGFFLSTLPVGVATAGLGSTFNPPSSGIGANDARYARLDAANEFSEAQTISAGTSTNNISISGSGRYGFQGVSLPYSTNSGNGYLVSGSYLQLTAAAGTVRLNGDVENTLGILEIVDEGFILPHVVNSAPSEPHTCDTDAEGSTVYARDTDSGAGELCVCGHDGTSFDWLNTNGMAGCSFF